MTFLPVEARRRYRVLAATISLMLAASALLAACGGGGGKKADPEDWVADLCEIAIDLNERGDARGDEFNAIDPSDGKDAKDAIVELLEEQLKDIERAADDYAQIGSPDIDGGEEAAKVIGDDLDETRTEVRKAIKAIEKLDTGRNFERDLIAAFADIEDTDLRAALEDLAEDHEEVEDLIALIDDDDSCAAVLFDDEDARSEPTPAPTTRTQATPAPTTRGQATTVPTTRAQATPTKSGPKTYSAPSQVIDAKTKAYSATIKTDKGDIVIRLFADQAPNTVNSFVFLAREGFFNGITFHRVVPNFVVQAGDPTGSGSGGPGYQVQDEPNTLTNKRGAISMAKTPRAAGFGSQFFINLKDNPGLDYNNTAGGDKFYPFGEVTTGMDVVDRIAQGDVIRSVTIQERPR